MDLSILEKIKNFCAYQERSHKDVRSKLLEYKIYGEDLELYISALIEENFLNEVRFAMAYAGGKFRIKKWGKVKILQGLKQHHVSAYCIKKALLEIDDEDYESTMNELAEKKLITLEKEKNVLVKKNKLRNYLLQKGFEPEYIYTFIAKHVN